MEQNTGLRVDGYLEIGFGGFVNIIDALGGIEMCLPKAIKDKDSHLNLPEGLPDPQRSRTLWATSGCAKPTLGVISAGWSGSGRCWPRSRRRRASPSTVVNPVRYWRLCNAAAQAIRIGEDTSFVQVITLGLAMRKISGGDGLTLTVPVSNPDASTPVGSAVLWDEARRGRCSPTSPAATPGT